MILHDEYTGLDWYQTMGAPIAIVERKYLALWTGTALDSFECREVPVEVNQRPRRARFRFKTKRRPATAPSETPSRESDNRAVGGADSSDLVRQDREQKSPGVRMRYEWHLKENARPPDYNKMYALTDFINRVEFAEGLGGASLIAITIDLIAARFVASHQVLMTTWAFGYPPEVFDGLLAGMDTMEWEDNFEFVVTDGEMVMFDSVEVGTEVTDVYSFRLEPGKYRVQTAHIIVDTGWIMVHRFIPR